TDPLAQPLRDGGAHDRHPRAGFQQSAHLSLGHRAAADDQTAAPTQVQEDGVRCRSLRASRIGWVRLAPRANPDAHATGPPVRTVSGISATNGLIETSAFLFCRLESDKASETYHYRSDISRSRPIEHPGPEDPSLKPLGRRARPSRSPSE